VLNSFFKLGYFHFQWKLAIIIVVSTLVIVIDRYRSFFVEKAFDHLFLFLGIPILFVVIIFREKPSQYGFQLGDWKAGLILTVVGMIFTLILMAFVAQLKDFKNYYSPQVEPVFQLILKNAIDLFGWEFLFRGLLLFALFPICGPYAILLQAVPFTIAHIGKPELETISCIFGGPLLGYVAWRTHSFLYPFLIHWFLATITILLAAG
jgi:membrane protease YdiL (CAAX protease family)